MAETLRGGGAAGPSKYWTYHGSWPFASLTVDFDAITFKLFPLTYRIERESIKHLAEYRILWTTQLQIIHVKASFPKCILFAPWSFARLKDVLGRHNYQVESGKDIRELYDPTIKYSNTLSHVIAALVGVAFAGMAAALLVHHFAVR